MGDDKYENPWDEEQEIRKPDYYQWRDCYQKSSVEGVSHIGKRAVCDQLVLSIQQVNAYQVK